MGAGVHVLTLINEATSVRIFGVTMQMTSQSGGTGIHLYDGPIIRYDFETHYDVC